MNDLFQLGLMGKVNTLFGLGRWMLDPISVEKRRVMKKLKFEKKIRKNSEYVEYMQELDPNEYNSMHYKLYDALCSDQLSLSLDEDKSILLFKLKSLIKGMNSWKGLIGLRYSTAYSSGYPYDPLIIVLIVIIRPSLNHVFCTSKNIFP